MYLVFLPGLYLLFLFSPHSHHNQWEYDDSTEHVSS